jgi:hypothetical protein
MCGCARGNASICWRVQASVHVSMRVSYLRVSVHVSMQMVRMEGAVLCCAVLCSCLKEATAARNCAGTRQTACYAMRAMIPSCPPPPTSLRPHPEASNQLTSTGTSSPPLASSASTGALAASASPALLGSPDTLPAREPTLEPSLDSSLRTSAQHSTAQHGAAQHGQQAGGEGSSGEQAAIATAVDPSQQVRRACMPAHMHV